MVQVDALVRKDQVDASRYGLGKREKKNVLYDDNLSEQQFMRV